MRTEYFITMDTHCRTTDACIKTSGGKLVRRQHLPTGIPQLRQLIESVPRPRRLCFEESSMAGWLYRNLTECVDELIVCDPRRNAHVAKDGDKDDAIDAEKLNDLYRGGFLKPVHQLDCVRRVSIKQTIALYHDRVAHRHQFFDGFRCRGHARFFGRMFGRNSNLHGLPFNVMMEMR